MSALLYFFIWAAVIFLMMRFGCGAHVMGHGHGKSKHGEGSEAGKSPSEGFRWTPPARDMDPVCGKTVNTDGARPSIHDGHVYYFCSRECREIFEAAPEQYVGPHAKEPQPQLENHHV